METLKWGNVYNSTALLGICYLSVYSHKFLSSLTHLCFWLTLLKLCQHLQLSLCIFCTFTFTCLSLQSHIFLCPLQSHICQYSVNHTTEALFIFTHYSVLLVYILHISDYIHAPLSIFTYLFGCIYTDLSSLSKFTQLTVNFCLQSHICLQSHMSMSVLIHPSASTN